MEILKVLLEPQAMAALLIAVAIGYLVGEVEGDHRSPTSRDPEHEAASDDAEPGRTQP
jgi:hypothetical protein